MRLRTLARHAVKLLADVGCCEDCGHDGERWRLETHHMDGDPTNNARSVLRKLCSKCHGTRHRGRARSCTVCDGAHYAKGLCQKHYMRDYRETVQGIERRTERTEPRVERSEVVRRYGCSVEGCERKHYAKGKCQAHYMREYLERRAQAFGAS